MLRDGAFGELLVDGHKPEEGRYVFASVQALAHVALDRIPPDSFDVVIVDEFHHAEAPTYRRLLEHLQPRELLGLTATPERSDGESVVKWFGGRIAAELRLWEALERGLLSPFQYFGVNDQTDLSHLRWTRGGYELADLEKLYTGNDRRLELVLRALRDRVLDTHRMRALGFCVSVAHAHYMAKRFNEAGIPARAVSADTGREERADSLRLLQRREIGALFAVDLFNEGVDVPEIDTVLFLRPTESATVFLQQLGRGLRLADGKDCLTVLDFIGQQHTRFRFDLRLRALTGASRGSLKGQINDGFPYLPPGCSIQLDRVAKAHILDNLRALARSPLREPRRGAAAPASRSADARRIPDRDGPRARGRLPPQWLDLDGAPARGRTSRPAGRPGRACPQPKPRATAVPRRPRVARLPAGRLGQADATRRRNPVSQTAAHPHGAPLRPLE